MNTIDQIQQLINQGFPRDVEQACREALALSTLSDLERAEVLCHYAEVLAFYKRREEAAKIGLQACELAAKAGSAYWAIKARTLYIANANLSAEEFARELNRARLLLKRVRLEIFELNELNGSLFTLSYSRCA